MIISRRLFCFDEIMHVVSVAILTICFNNSRKLFYIYLKFFVFSCFFVRMVL